MTAGGNTLEFINGTSVIFNGTEYWYVFNAQNDVIGIIDASGTYVVEYTYDAWGALLSKTGTMANTLGYLNPFRYRGYIYDEETGLYYVSSRYYDPAIGRWLNSDSVIADVGGDVRGYNTYTYCFNNPVIMIDETGGWPTWNDIVDGFDKAVKWVDKTIIQPINTHVVQPTVEFVGDIMEDVQNFDINNESEQKVLESNYFSWYKGTPVFRIDGGRSGSFGAMFITRETNTRDNPEDVVRHEYGHTVQLKQLGVIDYALCIALPSWQQWGSGEYYTKPWEITADIAGGVQSRKHKMSDIQKGFAYWELSDFIGPLAWSTIE